MNLQGCIRTVDKARQRRIDEIMAMPTVKAEFIVTLTMCYEVKPEQDKSEGLSLMSDAIEVFAKVAVDRFKDANDGVDFMPLRWEGRQAEAGAHWAFEMLASKQGDKGQWRTMYVSRTGTAVSLERFDLSNFARELRDAALDHGSHVFSALTEAGFKPPYTQLVCCLA